MPNEPWMDDRKKGSFTAFSRKRAQLSPKTQAERDWNSGVFSSHPLGEGAQRPSTFDPSSSSSSSAQYCALPSSYQPGRFAAPTPSEEEPDPARQTKFNDDRNPSQPSQTAYSSVAQSTSSPLLGQDTDLYVVAPEPTQTAEQNAVPSQQLGAMRELSTAEIDAHAFFDSQTQAYNFRYFVRRTQYELARANYFGRTLAILVVSIDHFKTLADAHGQSIVDSLLDTVANLLFSNCRPIDLIGRYMEGSFLIVCPEISIEQVSNLAENICSTVVENQWDNFKFSLSIGIAVSSPEFPEIESLIAIADLGAEIVTEQGGNAYCFAADED